jgi:hypothetical protein
MSETYHFAECVVEVDDARQYLVTRFSDGTYVDATPNRDEGSLRTASELGYGDDTWAMSRDHELAHSWLAFPDVSPMLWALAHGSTASRVEETTVMEFQRSLDKSAPRPWDQVSAATKESA